MVGGAPPRVVAGVGALSGLGCLAVPGAAQTASPTSSSAAAVPRTGAIGNGQHETPDGGQTAVVELLRYSPVADDLGRRFAEAGHRL